MARASIAILGAIVLGSGQVHADSSKRSGLRLRRDNDPFGDQITHEVAQELKNAAPYAVTTNNAIIRLASKRPPSPIWGGDRLKGFSGVGVVKDDFHAGAGLMGGVGNGEGHAEVGMGYEGIHAPGMKAGDWRTGVAQLKEKEGEIKTLGTAPADDGGMDVTEGFLKASSGHVDQATLG
mmetsp:Transcript_8684/g.19893  ORF Transcript_8684/g.19893 Transcript_8684/m.19893 type:complete len:179 (-) Transcript_8684:42-578(-)|eukprot:CAMPEP_0197903278 /NCGR_PEP_ID=MMETSP1439-20131203/55580_1 /TAXON_ID=66791 /ORGANISM="Gonyaulax spinifera, Strain CCMP409" /LENGTH=178 /DNA_ID=CAMNT_0043524389 /DNA_START=66 /DNA_END=602 /DNA_ORIENTATION=-